MPSQPLGEARPVMGMLAGASHHPNLGGNNTVKIFTTIDSNLFPLDQLLKADRAGDIFASLHLPPRHPSFNLNIGFETTRVGKTTGEVCLTYAQKRTYLLFSSPCSFFQSPLAHLLHDRPAKKEFYLFYS